MAYTISVRTLADAEAVEGRLRAYLRQSRFQIGQIETVLTKRRCDLLLHNIRLKEKKDYCGNHPGPCRVTGFERPHKRLTYLEGLDWCSFNDMVNDCLDELGMEASVRSVTCVIRRGDKRRVYYGCRSLWLGGFEHVDWEKAGDAEDFMDCRGQVAPLSEYPTGTPGIFGWRLKPSRALIRKGGAA